MVLLGLNCWCTLISTMSLIILYISEALKLFLRFSNVCIINCPTFLEHQLFYYSYSSQTLLLMIGQACEPHFNDKYVPLICMYVCIHQYVR